MDSSTEKAVTEALDTAIATVAEEQFTQLSRGLSNREVAEKVCKALCSFRAFQKGNLPDYDDWDALLYSVWYQPSQINLAYSLARRLFDKIMTGLISYDSHEVFDFGCGALAMQFGMALAAADVVEEHGVVPRIGIIPFDSSLSMINMGRKLWLRFMSEVDDFKKHKELYRLRQVNKRITYGVLNAPARRWLSALHVAYRDNHVEVKENLKARVKDFMPDFVLVTCHPMDASFAFSPPELGYRETNSTCNNQGLAIIDNFKFLSTRTFREKIREKIIIHQSDLPDCPFYYLENWPSWVTPYQSNISVYAKR